VIWTPEKERFNGLVSKMPSVTVCGLKNKIKDVAFSRDWLHIVYMRIITEPFLKEAAARFPQAAEWLENFRKSCKKALWKNIVDLRSAYSHADLAKVKSGRVVIVLNVCGNKYRLVIAAHFNTGVVYTLRFMTHAEYSKQKWKDEL
jgi:mRNA interferase HigB